MLRRTLGLVVTFLLLAATHLFGATSQVGTCTPATPQYATITIAVNNSNPGDTINICPGAYPEQVFINESLTLQGTGTGLASVQVPGGGMIYATSFQGTPVAPQIYVYSGANVTINNLTVDGAGNNITSCAPDLIGIYFQNASGTVTKSAVLNEVLPAGYTGCQSGEGIFAESANGSTSNVNVSGSLVENFQKNGITGNEAGTTLTASNNSIIGQGSTTGAAENGVQIAFGAAGTITGNTITDNIWGPDTFSDTGDAADGILVYASKGVSITSNQVTNSQFGIGLVSDPTSGKANANTVSHNIVSATHLFDAIDVCGNNNVISSNTINGADESGIHLDGSATPYCTGNGNNNSVTSNTINFSCAGVLTGTGSGNTIAASNNYFNVSFAMQGGDTCLPAPSGASSKASTKAAAKFSPKRH